MCISGILSFPLYYKIKSMYFCVKEEKKIFKKYINNDFFRTLPPQYPQPFNTTALNESDPTLAVETCLFLYLLLFFHMNE